MTWSYNTAMSARMVWKAFFLALATLALVGMVAVILTLLGLTALGDGKW